jgi:hypothetical protein
MQFIRHKAILCILGGMMYLGSAKSLAVYAMVAGPEPSAFFVFSEKRSIPNENKGYRDIVAYNDQFLAVGTDGRIDCISKSGEITPINNTLTKDLNGVIYTNQTIIAVGNEGTILFSSDGKTCSKKESGTDKNINSITTFKGNLIASADDGTLLVMESGNRWKQIQLPLEGDVVSISSGSSLCIGVTNKGEIIKTSDAINWEIFDYNKEYVGYNKPCSFKEVLITHNRIVIIGQHEDGSPVVLFSSFGSVWTERAVNYTDEHGMIQWVTNQPNDICYDAAGDQFFLVCNNGELLILPSCVKCNKSFTVSEYNLNGIMCLENTLMIVGDDYTVNVVEH